MIFYCQRDNLVLLHTEPIDVEKGIHSIQKNNRSLALLSSLPPQLPAQALTLSLTYIPESSTSPVTTDKDSGPISAPFD
jgi:hypothetical protein